MLRVKAVDVLKKQTQPHTGNTHQTVIEINTSSSAQSIRIGFTDQRLTASEVALPALPTWKWRLVIIFNTEIANLFRLCGQLPQN